MAITCPRCQNPESTRVSFTWWGGVLGPKLLKVVKCVQCSTQYNGQTGKLIGGAIAIYMVIVGVIAIGIVFALQS